MMELVRDKVFQSVARLRKFPVHSKLRALFRLEYFINP
jgi:phenylalanine-4-hydroxylase